MNRIITIGREFGSGGRELGRRLSEIMEIAYYDEEIIREIADRTEMSEKYIQDVIDRKPLFSFPIHIGGHLVTMPDPLIEQSQEVFRHQAEIIREMAAKSDCVIIGRCGDYILKELEPVRLFVYADMESKIRRCREKEPDDNRSDAALEKAIREVDKGRAAYYNHFTDRTWGDRRYYDLCVNTSNWTIRHLAERLSGMLY